MTKETKETHYKTGELESITRYTDGVIKGANEIYYETGELRFEINFKSGNRHGLSKHYYATGKLKHIISYYNGKLHGIWTDHNRKGAVISTSYHLYGKEVTKEEYREHELIEELAKLSKNI